MSAPLTGSQRRQIGLLTAGAVFLMLGLHFLRGRPGLTHMDFVAGGPGSLEFCDPANPRFLPVVARSSPVTLAASAVAPAVAGAPVTVVLHLRTNTGKPIGPRDLQLTGAHALNILLIDPALADFQAAQPEPGAQPGAWTFTFTPQRDGAYRIFADFTPAATGQELYASVVFPVAAGDSVAPAPPAASVVVENAGLRYTLLPEHVPVRAREPLELNFAVTRADGGSVSLRPIDGTRARLVAFDQRRSGFVNLSPDPDAAASPEGKQPHLSFRVTIPDPGNYLIWSRINDGRTEVAGPFSLEVMP